MGREEPSDSHPIINEGGAWAVPGQVRVVPEPGHGQSGMQYFYMSSELSLILACHKRTVGPRSF
jgi:hypothetical protein